MAREGREHQRFVDGVRLVAGCVPLLAGQVVLISNRKDPRKLGLPKGGWEDDEPTCEHAAVREAYEEAGTKGITGASLCPAEVTSKSGTRQRIEWFVLYVTELVDDWPERAQRNRVVMSLEESIQRVHRPEHRKALEEVKLPAVALAMLIGLRLRLF